jgi:hypothetical protein
MRDSAAVAGAPATLICATLRCLQQALGAARVAAPLPPLRGGSRAAA